MAEAWWALIALMVGGIVVAAGVALARSTRARPAARPSLAPERADKGAARDLARANAILDRMTEGVVVLNGGLRPTYANRSVRGLLGLQEGPTPRRLASAEIKAVARRALAEHRPVEDTVEVFYPRRSVLRVEATPLQDGDDVLVVLQDVTEGAVAQRIRKEFVAHASHELKTPVASLQALAEAIAEALPGDVAAAERFSDRLEHEAVRLSKLVTDLLDLSRLEDPLPAPERPCDLARVIDQEVSALQPRAEQARIDLETQVARPLPALVDQEQAALLVRNLLENAVQYSDPGGRVAIRAERAGEEILMAVTDEGIGIPSDAQARVFERFYRVDRARSRDRGGTGLGLAIVKHVAEAYGGHVEVASELGRGSRFTVSFPLHHHEGNNEPGRQSEPRSA